MFSPCRSVHSSTRASAVPGNARNSAIPARASPGSILSSALATAYSCSNSFAQAAHISASERNG